jgi:hypothetical protein
MPGGLDVRRRPAGRLQDAELGLQLRAVAPEGVERVTNLVGVVPAAGRRRQVLDPRQSREAGSGAAAGFLCRHDASSLAVAHAREQTV